MRKKIEKNFWDMEIIGNRRKNENIPIRKRKTFQLEKGKYSIYKKENIPISKKENISNLRLEIEK